MSDNHHKPEGFERIVSEDRISPEMAGRCETKTLVCLYAVLRGDERDDKIFDKLEDFYLSNYAQL